MAPDSLAETTVVVLCGGRGTRLRDTVPDRPKPMADIDSRPFLHRLLDHVAGYGFQRFVLCVGYMAGAVKEYFDKTNVSYSVVCSEEAEPLGTAGALRNAADVAEGDPVVVLNGDSFCKVPYALLLESHRSRGGRATVVVTTAGGNAGCGRVVFDQDQRIQAFLEKPECADEQWVNAGVYVLSRDTFESLETGCSLSLETDIFPRLVGTALWAFPVDGPLVDIGTPERYHAARVTLTDLMR